MAQIRVTSSTPIRVDHAAVARAAATAILNHNNKRITAGDDVADQKLPGYSQLYQQQLVAIGANTSPAARLAALAKKLKVVRTTTTGGRTSISFGIDGTVMSTSRPPPYVFDRNKTPEQRARALANWKASVKETESHDVDLVLKWLASGTSDRRPRRVLGVSPRGRAEVNKAIENARVFVTK